MLIKSWGSLPLNLLEEFEKKKKKKLGNHTYVYLAKFDDIQNLIVVNLKHSFML